MGFFPICRYEGLGSLSDMSSLNSKKLSPEEAAEARKAAKIEMEKLSKKKPVKGKGKK